MNRLAVLGAGLCLMLIGCEPEPDFEDVVREMVVQTNYDRTVDFNNFTTYTLTPDTVGFVSNRSEQSAVISDYSRAITAAVKRNLDESGLVSVPLDGNPDIGVNVFIVDDVSIFRSVYFPNYFWGYPGYPGAFYGGYFGYLGFYNYPFITTNYFRQAVLVIEMVDLVNIQDENARVVWTANIGDIINTGERTSRTLEAIDQAFDQSQYIAVEP